jgi:hypothetical protein
MEPVLLEKPPDVQLLKNFEIFYKTRKFVTVFVRACTGSYPEPDESGP